MLNIVDFIQELTSSSLRQCSVTPHRSDVEFLRQNTPDFMAADKWTSYSADLNPVDYCIWDSLQDLMYEGRRMPFANPQDRKEGLFKNILDNGKKTDCG